MVVVILLISAIWIDFGSDFDDFHDFGLKFGNDFNDFNDLSDQVWQFFLFSEFVLYELKISLNQLFNLNLFYI